MLSLLIIIRREEDLLGIIVVFWDVEKVLWLDVGERYQGGENDRCSIPLQVEINQGIRKAIAFLKAMAKIL